MNSTSPSRIQIQTPPPSPRSAEISRGERAAVHIRLGLVALGGLSLLSGLNAALLLLGVWAPVRSDRLADVHGVVMVLGFLGSLIAIERAQALRRGWAYLAPALLGAGALVLAFGGPFALGQLLLLDGSLALMVVYLFLWRRAPLGIVAVQVLSAVLAACAAALWLRVDLPALLPLLAGFLVLTIAAERAELAQLALGPRATPILLGVSSAITLAAVASLVWPDAGARAFGACLIITSAWLVRDDVPRRMIRTDGLRRYNAAALLAGYLWLAVAGLTWLIGGVPDARPSYDMAVHGVFLGFGVSMVMAHAPIIFPAVLNRDLPYRPLFWVPLGVLHTSVAVRFIGDLTGMDVLWRIGSIGGVISILLLALAIVTTAVRA